jgi:hypothetical protein
MIIIFGFPVVSVLEESKLTLFPCQDGGGTQGETLEGLNCR